ncbi:metal-dependent hydrolase [Natrarchaeobius sp. A-rgal3]|uniref:metal-dependent hydrolase n=1 Tax=Natrarchaeobius versutus TaxID=1679078 RepID=UPI00350F4818
MMVTTHALVGLFVALPVAILVPEHGPTALAAGALGGVVPDLDVFAEHRRTLHHPVYGFAAAVVALAAAVTAPTALTLGAFVFSLAAALHCVGDVVSCGLGARPWDNPPSDRAVYDHVRGTWVPPRRWIPYDGSPADLGFAAVISLPLVLVLDGAWELLIVSLLAVSIGYTVSRKRLEDVAKWGVRFLPPSARRYVPERYLVR